MNLYDLALSIATNAHVGQVDKAGLDYIQHPLYVASLVDSEYEKATALLHDVIEDTGTALEDLKTRGIPTEVVEAVSVITKQKGEKYFDYLTRVKSNPIARKVKIADIQHNSDLSRLPNPPTERDLGRTERYKRAMEYLK